MSPIETVASLLGLANIVLLVRRSVWNFPFGMAMVALFGWLFLSTRLYSDALLQLFFFVVQAYGWWAWTRAPAVADGGLVVERLGMSARLLWVAGGGLAALTWGAAMHRLTNAVFPYWDAAIAWYSVCAQVLLTRRYIENWWLWIAVDAGAIGLYAARGLYLTTGLYILFLLLAIWGLLAWARAAHEAPERPA